MRLNYKSKFKSGEKMDFHKAMLKDDRRRFYLPVKRILKNNGVQNAGLLLENQAFQTVIHYSSNIVLFNPGDSILLDFGQSVHGGIRFNQEESPGVIRVSFGESISEAIGEANEDSSRKKAVLELPNYGMLEYGNTVFRFVEIKNIGEIPIRCQNIMAVVLEQDLEVTGSFESSDERLNQIWKTAIRTVHLCMQDYIYDGAKRDRIVWMGDMHPEIRGILCGFSDTKIIRRSFEFLMSQSSPDYPMNEYYTYSCWFIISLWDYLCVTSDFDFIYKHADYIEAVIKKFAAYVSGDGKECIPERRFLDWPNEAFLQAKNAGIHALLYWMMSAGSKLLRFIGRDSSIPEQAAQKSATYIPDPDGRKAPAALLTLTGLADRRDVLETEPFQNVSTFYGFYMLLAKDTIPALQLIRNYWGAMLDFGATSFWEDFDLKWTENATGIDEFPVKGKKDIHADFGNYCYLGLRHSLSHGWSCGPAPFLSERVLGVKFIAPGTVSVKPDPGDLEYIKGTVPVPSGLITVEADKSGKQKITLPDGIRLFEGDSHV